MNREISERIWMTRYLMVVGILVLHLPPYQPLGNVGSTGFDYIKAFFAHGLFRAAVPVLTVMSGYLLFRSKLHLHYFDLLKTKTNSILIPLILWNIPLAIAVYVLQKYNLGSHEFSAKLYPADFPSWVNAITGLNGSPVNYPLNFLRDLIAVSLLAPFFGVLLKYIPYPGLVVVLCIYFFNLDGPLVLRNSMLVSFYLGGLAYTQSWNLFALDKYAGIAVAILVFACILIVAFKIQNREWFRLIAPFLIWPSMSLLAGTTTGRFLYKNAQSSFFTFLAHGPIILVLWFAYQKIFSDGPYALYWFSAPVITVCLSILLSQMIKKQFPAFSRVILGGR